VSGLRFYSAEIHFSLRCLAEKYERLMKVEGRIIGDSSPIFIK
jgi:hypothetical protein